MTQHSLIKEKGVTRLNGIDSRLIVSLLRDRHIKDVFVPECKNGETWGARDLLKMDAWVLRRSYSPLTTIGYEVKCSRQDFEQDQKWTGYLDLCHLFYFVCPAGLIRATDLPQSIGIIWVSSSHKLRVKRKAERSDPDSEKLNRLLIYVLMARCNIVDNMYAVGTEPLKDNLQLIREAVERANERQELAYFVKGHIRDMYEQTKKIDRDIKDREDTLKRFEDKLARLGITWDSNQNQWQEASRVQNEIEMLNKNIDNYTIDRMRTLASQLTGAVEMITRYREKEAIVKKETGGSNESRKLSTKEA